MFDYDLEYVCTYTATLATPPEVIGPVAEGLRMNVYITGGTLEGPRLQGQVRPVGADWVTIRPDGVSLVDVRATFETHDGAHILMTYNGIALPDGESLRVRTAPLFQTGHPDYAWLNRVQAVGLGTPGGRGIVYDVYQVL